MDELASFMGRQGYLPHGYCFTWSPALLWSMVAADLTIAAAYFSIPLAMLNFVRQREQLSMKWVFGLFGAFIAACGITHVMDVWVIWQPDYGLQAITKMLTAAVSLVTAVALWPLIPKALKIPTVSQLQKVIGSLEAEIQQRRSAEENLAVADEALVITLASIGAGFMATDRQGRVTRMNAVAEIITGMRQQEALGRPLWTVLVRQDQTGADINPVDTLVQTTATIKTVDRIVVVSKTGTHTPLEVQTALTYALNDTVRGMVMVFRDMTRLEQAEVQASQLAAIVESSQDAIIGKTLDGRITSWNQAAQSMFGYTQQEAIGQAVQILIPQDRVHEEMRILKELSQGIKVPVFHTIRRHKSGALIDVALTISPVRDKSGRIVGASKIARDISRQKRAEEALHESQTRLLFALETAQIGDWELDLTTHEMRRSLRHDQCLGYDTPQKQWHIETFFEHVLPVERPGIERSFHRAIEQRTDWQAECQVVWPDNTLHWVSVHGRIFNDNSQPPRMLGIIADISQQKQSETLRLEGARLEAENKQIQEASRLKSSFLANMSHELRTPLNAVIGFADLLQAGAVPTQSPKHQEFLGYIGTSGRHLLQLINNVLDLSKVESGKLDFSPEPLHLPTLVKEITDILGTSAERQGLRLHTHIDEAVEHLVLDPARLKQALYNYVSNAIKFTPQGGHITITATAHNAEQVRIAVEDTGVGIAQADLPRLFVEFQQLENVYTKRHSGTGLGLALTKRLVQAQGGSVGVSSQAGSGSVFYLILPRHHHKDMPQSARMLIIENHPDQAHIARGVADMGVTVDSAVTAAQAMALTSNHQYEAISLGLRLPDQNGLSLLSTLRESDAGSHTPVVALTLPTENSELAGFSIADVFAKPLHTQHVLAGLERLKRSIKQLTRIMVIDDDAMALELMQTTLLGAGFDVDCVLDGRDALMKMDSQRPDVIILDLMMPDFDGFEVLNALHQNPSWRHTPVFIWTSMLLTDEELAYLTRSARALLNKDGGTLDHLLDELRHKLLPQAAIDWEGQA